MTERLLDKVPAAVVDVGRRLASQGHSAWVVGGSLRDLLLGREVHDWDLASTARPDDVKGLFRRVVPTGEKHGTVTVLHRGMQLEVTTLRGEGAYSDGRRPDEVEFVDDIREDLSRRDLTINAMALDLETGELLDPFGGREDLEAGVVRAVGDAAARFAEDGLRVMRALRFATTLEIALEDATLAAIPGALDTFRKVSAERVRDELLKMLAARRPARGLRLLEQTGLLAEVLPEVADAVGGEGSERWARVVEAAPPGTATRLAALLHAAGVGETEAAARLDALRLSRRDRDRTLRLLSHLDLDVGRSWSDAELRRWMRDVGLDATDDLLALRRADLGLGPSPAEDLPRLDALADRISEQRARGVPLAVSDLAVDGRLVMSHLGLEPGRRVGEVLEALLERVLDEPEANDRDRLLELARQCLDPGPGNC